MEYNVSNYVLMNQLGGVFIGDKKIYTMEHFMEDQEKIDFMDKYITLTSFNRNANISYIIDVIHKFESNFENFKVDNWGCIKDSSLIPWLKKNDPNKFFDNSYKIGSYYLFGYRGNINTGFVLSNPYSENISCVWVTEIFHRFLKSLEQVEINHFKENDPVQIKITTIRNYVEKFGNLNNELANIYKNKNISEVSEERVNQYLSLYKSIEDAYYKAQTEAKKIAE